MSRRLFIILFLLISLSCFFVFGFYPVVRSGIESFLRHEGFQIIGFAGLDNWTSIFTSESFLNVSNLFSFQFPMGAFLQNTIWLAIHLPATVILGLTIALLTQDLKGGTIIRVVIFLGMVTPTIVGGMMFTTFYGIDIGLFNELLRVIGLGSLTGQWLMLQDRALFALIGAGLWIQTGFSLIIYSAGLATIPDQLTEAAEVDGANPWQRFRHVIWPSLKPATGVVLIMAFSWVIRVFGIVYASTGGGPGGATNILGLMVYRRAFEYAPAQLGKAQVVAMVEVLLSLPLAIYLLRMGEE